MATTLPFAPKIVYGSGPTTLALINTSGMWLPDMVIRGGSSESAAGVPETFITRKDGLLSLALRFFEEEWPAIAAWVEWCMVNGSAGYFTFYPDQNKALNYQCWLIKPKVNDSLSLRRVQGYAEVLELDVQLRTRNTGTLFDVRIT